MESALDRVRLYLEDYDIRFHVEHHHLRFTAQEVAADTHTPGIEFAKTVIVKAGDGMVMLVVPAHHLVNCRKLGRTLDKQFVRIAREVEVAQLLAGEFPQCSPGALPPFGELFDVRVYMSQAMLDDVYITFSAGTHEDVIRMSMPDYIGLVHPIIGDYSEPVGNGVPRYDDAQL